MSGGRVRAIRGMRHSLLPLLVVIGLGWLFASASSASEAGVDDSEAMVDEGSWYSRVEWPHDGHPVESSMFVVYGDRSSSDARREVSEVAEGLWADLLDEFLRAVSADDAGEGAPMRVLPGVLE